MTKLNSAIRKVNFKKRELPVVTEAIKAYKAAGFKVIDGIESIMIEEPGSTFRIFISRISYVLQFYYAGEWQFVKEFCTHDLESAAHIIEEEIKYKKEFG